MPLALAFFPPATFLLNVVSVLGFLLFVFLVRICVCLFLFLFLLFPLLV
jgi:hypothetical protein